MFQAKEEMCLSQTTAAMLTERMEDGSSMEHLSNRLRTGSLELSVTALCSDRTDLGSVNRALRAMTGTEIALRCHWR